MPRKAVSLKSASDATVRISVRKKRVVLRVTLPDKTARRLLRQLQRMRG